MKKFTVNRFIVLLGLSLLPFSFVAAEDKKPDFQIADNTFFDPTKKENKDDKYAFGVEYRLEAGYVQHQQRTRELSFPDMYMHGGRIGVTFTFKLPLHFGIQTSLLYTILYGQNQQHWRSLDAPSVQTEYIQHRVLAHHLTVPLRLYYTIPLWKELNLFFYTGPQLHIGLVEKDNMQTYLSENAHKWVATLGYPTEPYDRLADELIRANIQWGLGGGLEWDRYRLQSGYDFGLNNLVRHKKLANQYMAEWGWFISFSYRF